MAKRRTLSLKGVSIVCLVVLLVGVLGYVFYNKWIEGAQQPQTAKVQAQPSGPTDVPAVASAQDLSKVESTLDNADLSDDGTLTNLDSQLNAF